MDFGRSLFIFPQEVTAVGCMFIQEQLNHGTMDEYIVAHLKTVPKIHPQYISCFDLLSLTAQLTSKTPHHQKKNSGCSSSLMRQQNINHGRSFSPHYSPGAVRAVTPPWCLYFPPRSSPTLFASFCLMNFQSVRASISTLLLFFLLVLYHLWPISVLLPRLWQRVGWLVGWLVGSGGMGGGWFARFQANWNIHVCVPVSLCESAFTCTPPRSLYTYVGFIVSVVWSGQLLVKSPACWYVCISARVSVRLHFILFIFFARWCVKPCRLI